MQLFFTDSADGQTAWLNDEETRHCKVLRKQVGDTIHCIDGKGRLLTCELISLGKGNAELKIMESVFHESNRAYQIHLYISPTKNNERIEWMLEKAVETGLDGLHFIETEHSEKNRIKADRLRRIAVSALKQSAQYHLPEITEPVRFSDIKPPEGQNLMAHCREGNRKSLKEVFSASQPKGRINVFIGPEGDFSAKEVQSFRERGVTEIHLGDTRLRTETAALYTVVAISALSF